MLWWAIALSTWANPPANESPGPKKAPVVIEVVPTVVEGQFKVTLADHEGDDLLVDGWPAGTLPVVTTLAEGPHRFRIKRGETLLKEIEAYVIPVADKVVEIDLAHPPKPPPPEPTP